MPPSKRCGTALGGDLKRIGGIKYSHLQARVIQVIPIIQYFLSLRDKYFLLIITKEINHIEIYCGQNKSRNKIN